MISKLQIAQIKSILRVMTIVLLTNFVTQPSYAQVSVKLKETIIRENAQAPYVLRDLSARNLIQSASAESKNLDLKISNNNLFKQFIIVTHQEHSRQAETAWYLRNKSFAGIPRIFLIDDDDFSVRDYHFADQATQFQFSKAGQLQKTPNAEEIILMGGLDSMCLSASAFDLIEKAVESDREMIRLRFQRDYIYPADGSRTVNPGELETIDFGENENQFIQYIKDSFLSKLYLYVNFKEHPADRLEYILGSYKNDISKNQVSGIWNYRGSKDSLLAKPLKIEVIIEW